MPEKKKVAFFLPPIERLPQRNMLIPQPKKHVKSDASFGLSHYSLRSRREQDALNHQAEIAALNGQRDEVERYCRKGASLYAFARQVGISGDVAYAEFLVQSNPQEKNLVDELALGFYASFQMNAFNFFCRKYQSRFLLLKEQGLENKFRRKKSLACETLKAELTLARSELFEKLSNRNLVRKKSFESSSSEESFTLSP